MSIVLKSAENFDEIKRLYMTAFPKEERAPFFMIKNKARQGKADMLAAWDGDEFVGFVYLLRDLDMAYLFYFAITQDKRGCGYGSEILALLRERYAGKRFFLAREQLDEEAENYGQRCRRHEFYLRNGFEDLHFQIKEASVVYDAMGIGGEISSEEYKRLIDHWVGSGIRKMADMRIIERQS